MRRYLSEVRPRGGDGGGAFVYALMQGVVGEPLQGGNLVITEATDLGLAGEGPAHWLQVTKVSVKAGQSATIGVVLRPGTGGLAPTGRLDDVDFTNYHPLLGLLPDELDSVADVAADAVFAAGLVDAVANARLWHHEGASAGLEITTAVAPDVFSAVVNSVPAGAYTAFHPGQTISITVNSADGALADAVLIDGVLVHEALEPSTSLTFDWEIPAVELVGQDAAWDFEVTLSRNMIGGAAGTLEVPLQVPGLIAHTMRAEDYPGAQVALKGTETVIMTGRLQTPSTGVYSVAAAVPSGFSLVSQSYASGGLNLVDYEVVLARVTAAEGQHTLQFVLTGTASGMAVTTGEHKCDVQLTAPTIAWELNRLTFGPTPNMVSVRSNKRLQTPPGMANFSFHSEIAAGSNWDYRYTRTLSSPAVGETVGLSATNSSVISSSAIGGSGIEQAVVGGTYKMYGWTGEYAIEFDTPFRKDIELTEAQRYSFVDAGPITATSNASEDPEWALCDVALVITAAPAATHLKIIDGGENASGTLTISLVNE